MEEKRKIRIVQNYISKLPSLSQNVGVYCRVSSNSQEQLNSLANQASFFIQMVSHRHDWHLVDIYLDFKSGETIAGRSEFQRMLEDCRNRKIDIILTKSISRFGRNTEETIKALHELKDSNVKVIFDEENLDTVSANSELMISILSAYAQAENASHRNSQNWSINRRLEEGTSEIYTRSCYGYRKGDKGELIIESSEAKIVQNIFQNYLSGKSVIGIIKDLNANGIDSPTGKNMWCKRSIDTLLSNEKYVGNAMAFKTYSIISPTHKRISNRNGHHLKYVVEGNHPAIISKEMFEAVQAEKARRSNLIIDENGSHRKSTKYSSKSAKRSSD